MCGDAHVRNLGAYATADGRLVFDINDFDETVRGPWEWDLKRLATSLVLASEEADRSEKQHQESVRPGYVGGSAKLDKAVAEFAVAYAAQTQADFKLFVKSLHKR